MDWLDLAGLPLRIGVIVLAALLLALALRFVVSRLIKRLNSVPTPRLGQNARVTVGPPNPRRRQRLATFRTVLNSAIVMLIGTVALLMVLSELGVDVRPLLASAGVVGVALAFGAQALVSDMFNGLFVLIEDQYGVGDRIEVSAGALPTSGTVVEVALRVTTLRDDDGRIWYIRNGQIMRVGNESQSWSLAIVEVRVPAKHLAQAREAMAQTTEQVRTDGPVADAISPGVEPEFRVEDLAAGGATLRWAVRTVSGRQWEVATELRTRIAEVFTEREITLAE